MNTIEMFVIQGELACAASRGLHQHFMQSQSTMWQGSSHFADACHFLSCIRSYINNERQLYVEALIGAVGDGPLVAQINERARAVDELLDDIVMLHVDEPDGSFFRGMSELLSSFEQLVTLMRDSLPSLAGQSEETLDVRHLQVLLRNAA